MKSAAAFAAAMLLAGTVVTTAAADAVSTAHGPAAYGTATRTAAPADGHVKRRPVNARAARALGPTGEMRGIALNDVGGERLLEGAIPAFPRLAAEGVTSVTVYIYLYVASPTGSTVTTTSYTATDAELQLVADAAHANGLDLHLAPVLLDSASGGWRGTYRPDNLRAFFASYTTQVLHYADLAQSVGATLFYVGSENRLIESATPYWNALIASTRKHFKGALSYLAIPQSAYQVKFWDKLDLAAISPYFSLGTEPLPSYNRIVAAWRQVNVPAVEKIVRSTKTPVVYGEIGYNSQKGAFTNPPSTAKVLGTPAPAAQADAYRALLDVLARTPGVYGVTWWRWTTATTVADMGFSPNGKPAECQIAAHWSQDATVRTLASQPVCDLHVLDATLGNVPITAVPAVTR